LRRERPATMLISTQTPDHSITRGEKSGASLPGVHIMRNAAAMHPAMAADAPITGTGDPQFRARCATAPPAPDSRKKRMNETAPQRLATTAPKGNSHTQLIARCCQFQCRKL